jgi:Sec-independent protein translocase protein TatA
MLGVMAKGIKSFKRGMSDEEKKEDKNLENKNDEEK